MPQIPFATNRRRTVMIFTCLDRKTLSWATFIIVITATIGAATGAISLNGIISKQPSHKDPATFWPTLENIVATNFSSCLLLYTGVITLGIGALLATFMLATFVGATMSAAANNTSWEMVIASIWPYAPLEFLGFIVAGVAGAWPTIATCVNQEKAGWIRPYGDGMATSLKILALAALIISTAAVIEAAIIAVRFAG